jgi:hypothetical protein
MKRIKKLTKITPYEPSLINRESSLLLITGKEKIEKRMQVQASVGHLLKAKSSETSIAESVQYIAARQGNND